jgi:hypothetical protein
MLADESLRKKVRQEGTTELFLDDDFRCLADYVLAKEGEEGQLPQDLVDASLDEGQQALLAGLVLQQDQGWADNPELIFADCRRAVANEVLKQRLRQVNGLLEDARENNDEAAEVKYLQEFIEINQKLKKKL